MSSASAKSKGKERMTQVPSSSFFQTVANNATAAAAETRKRQHMHNSISSRGSASSSSILATVSGTNQQSQRPPLHPTSNIENLQRSTTAQHSSTAESTSTKRARTANGIDNSNNSDSDDFQYEDDNTVDGGPLTSPAAATTPTPMMAQITSAIEDGLLQAQTRASAASKKQTPSVTNRFSYICQFKVLNTAICGVEVAADEQGSTKQLLKHAQLHGHLQQQQAPWMLLSIPAVKSCEDTSRTSWVTDVVNEAQEKIHSQAMVTALSIRHAIAQKEGNVNLAAKEARDRLEALKTSPAIDEAIPVQVFLRNGYQTDLLEASISERQCLEFHLGLELACPLTFVRNILGHESSQDQGNEWTNQAVSHATRHQMQQAVCSFIEKIKQSMSK
ncbi:hypothetical protein BDR26DRAFT_1001719 [Obelidium mucronatum]|nr:hypothetical protein BDR26DRAFT_1001719 [Obelidium mucronatum]